MGRRRIKRKKKKEPASNVVPLELPDRRLTERHLAAFGDPSDPSDPQTQAQELIWQALESRNPRDQINAAREALSVYPDCVDAYNILAENAPSVRQTMEFYKKGIEAGERELGADFIAENSGYFWGVLETRPYMRALQGFAQCCVHVGEKESAAICFTKMLELNPNDNQGVRDEVIPLLIELEKLDEASVILERYEEDALASAAYNRALLAFRQSGDTRQAQGVLDKALKANKHVPKLLCGKQRMPKPLPDYYGIGDVNEAVFYVFNSLSAWKATPGAIDWMVEHA